MKVVQSLLGTLWNVTLFVAASIIFLPAFLIVTFLHDYWSKKLGELFGL